MNFKNLVFAAGGILVHKKRIAAVHRPKYDDWSLPKGKLNPGENFLSAAIREVQEETFCRPDVIHYAGSVYYTVNEKHKYVLFWIMKCRKIQDFIANDEIDQLKWIEFRSVRNWLHYPQEINLVESAFDDNKAEYTQTPIPDYDIPPGLNTLEEAVFILEQELINARRTDSSVSQRQLSEHIRNLKKFMLK